VNGRHSGPQVSSYSPWAKSSLLPIFFLNFKWYILHHCINIVVIQISNYQSIFFILHANLRYLGKLSTQCSRPLTSLLRFLVLNFHNFEICGLKLKAVEVVPIGLCSYYKTCGRRTHGPVLWPTNFSPVYVKL
jgi:hypothetical protein